MFKKIAQETTASFDHSQGNIYQAMGVSEEQFQTWMTKFRQCVQVQQIKGGEDDPTHTSTKMYALAMKNSDSFLEFVTIFRYLVKVETTEQMERKFSHLMMVKQLSELLGGEK